MKKDNKYQIHYKTRQVPKIIDKRILSNDVDTIIIAIKEPRNKNVDNNLTWFFNSIHMFLGLLIHKGLKILSKLPIIKNATFSDRIFIIPKISIKTPPKNII